MISFLKANIFFKRPHFYPLNPEIVVGIVFYVFCSDLPVSEKQAGYHNSLANAFKNKKNCRSIFKTK
jgi:hypothetical protein